MLYYYMHGFHIQCKQPDSLFVNWFVGEISRSARIKWSAATSVGSMYLSCITNTWQIYYFPFNKTEKYVRGRSNPSSPYDLPKIYVLKITSLKKKIGSGKTFIRKIFKLLLELFKLGIFTIYFYIYNRCFSIVSYI